MERLSPEKRREIKPETAQKPRNIFRALSTIFCTTGLLYQSCQLLSQYMSGKSVVNIEVKRETYSHLPGDYYLLSRNGFYGVGGQL